MNNVMQTASMTLSHGVMSGFNVHTTSDQEVGYENCDVCGNSYLEMEINETKNEYGEAVYTCDGCEVVLESL